jgi:hypothetical protein
VSVSVVYVLLALLWIGASLGGGAFLALLGKRIHASLSFRKLWFFYSTLLAVSAAVLFAIGMV